MRADFSKRHSWLAEVVNWVEERLASCRKISYIDRTRGGESLIVTFKMVAEFRSEVAGSLVPSE